jgi:hypothetical protein
VPFFQVKVSHHSFCYSHQPLSVGFSGSKKTKLSHQIDPSKPVML